MVKARKWKQTYSGLEEEKNTPFVSKYKMF
jgi:hypothetical protein